MSILGCGYFARTTMDSNNAVYTFQISTTCTNIQFELWMFATTDTLDIAVWQENTYRPNGEMFVSFQSHLYTLCPSL